MVRFNQSVVSQSFSVGGGSSSSSTGRRIRGLPRRPEGGQPGSQGAAVPAGQRGSCSPVSESSVSAVTGYTGYTTTTATALQTVGGSIAAASRSPKSIDSAGSLVAHHSGGEEPLSMNERMQAFLNGSYPELDDHINARLARQTETLQRQVDEDLATKFLRQTQQRRVFDGRANYLRWQSARHQHLQKELDKSMPSWILEAMENWDQKKAMQEKAEKDIDTTLHIFKRRLRRRCSLISPPRGPHIRLPHEAGCPH